MNALTVGSLFSGVGGFDLGFERAGMRTVWFCEQDPFCQRVLARHWPGVPCHPDVRALVADADERRQQVDPQSNGSRQLEPGGREQRYHADRCDDPASDRSDVVPVPVPPVDILCGGFPCQDISLAGAGAGIDGTRSGLWGEYARLIGELRPRYVVVENVAALLARGMGRVLGDLAALGYDAEWDCIPASAVGAPHRRDRVWVVAYPGGVGNPNGAPTDAYAAQGASRAPVGERGCRARGGAKDQGRPVDDAVRGRHGAPEGHLLAGRDSSLNAGWWLAEPDVGRVAHGVPARVDRLRALGNALVPQIAEWIGRRIVSWETQP